jgi:hypothetical protein
MPRYSGILVLFGYGMRFEGQVADTLGVKLDPIFVLRGKAFD